MMKGEFVSERGSGAEWASGNHRGKASAKTGGKPTFCVATVDFGEGLHHGPSNNNNPSQEYCIHS